MKRLLLCSILALSNMLPLGATKVYYLNPSIDLSTFISNLKHISDDDIVVKLSEGIYYLNSPLAFNVECRVPIKIVGKGEVVISGAEPLLDWVEMDNGIWRTKAPSRVRYGQLLVDGTITPRAKTPNDGSLQLLSGELVRKEGNEVVYKVVLPKEYAAIVKKINGDERPLINLLRLFTHSRASIMTFNELEGSITFKEAYTQSYFKPGESTRIFIENFFAALDAPGEWYQDGAGFLYYYPKVGEIMNKIRISGTKLKNLVTISGAPDNYAGNISFDNIIFEGCDVVGSDKGIPPYQSAYTLDGAIITIYARNVNISNCEFRGLGGYAVWFNRNCIDCVFSHNYIHDIGGGGVKIGGLKIAKEYVSNNIIVTNNIIHKIGRIYIGSAAIFLTYAMNCNISHNDISDGYYSGISAGFSWGYSETPTCNNKICYNVISNIGQDLLNDMAGIYTLGVSHGTIISNNVIKNIRTSFGGGFGIYTDEGSSDILIEDNIAYYCDGGGFHQHYGSNNIVRNNIFAYGERTNLAFSSIRKPEDVQVVFENNIVLVSEGDALSGDALKEGKFVFRNNCFHSTTGQTLTVNGEVIDKWMNNNGFSFLSSSPNFRNPQKGDFRFKSRRIARTIGFKTIKTEKVGADWKPKKRITW